MRQSSIVGEMSDKVNGRYELFTRRTNWFPKTHHPCEHPFVVKRLDKNTVFALLALGKIKKDNLVGSQMEPFSRDCWYICED